MKDGVVLVGVVVAFAALVTSHVAIVAGLAMRAPRWRALAALLLPVLSPYWAVRDAMRVRAVMFCASAIAYVVFRVLAST